MNFEGRWKTKNGDTYIVVRLDLVERISEKDSRR